MPKNNSHQAGKGDRYRSVDYKKWSDNYDQIFGKKEKTVASKQSTAYVVCEKTFEYNDEYMCYEGGCDPNKVFLIKEEAEKERERLNLKFLEEVNWDYYDLDNSFGLYLSDLEHIGIPIAKDYGSRTDPVNGGTHNLPIEHKKKLANLLDMFIVKEIPIEVS